MLQARTLSFSRDQEYQADVLGIRYLTAAGYDPAGGATMLAALTRATRARGARPGRRNRSTPEWASTHPLSENRMRQARAGCAQADRPGRARACATATPSSPSSKA